MRSPLSLTLTGSISNTSNPLSPCVTDQGITIVCIIWLEFYQAGKQNEINLLKCRTNTKNFEKVPMTLIEIVEDV